MVAATPIIALRSQFISSNKLYLNSAYNAITNLRGKRGTNSFFLSFFFFFFFFIWLNLLYYNFSRLSVVTRSWYRDFYLREIIFSFRVIYHF